MSDTKTPEQMAEDFASEKIGKSWQLGQGSAWLPAITTEQRFDQCVHAFLAGYEAARPKWISVKERLPDPYKEVLIFQPRLDTPLIGIYDSDRNDWDIGDHTFHSSSEDVTHWMPLPEAKEGEK